jgi:hypothetical protein
MIEKKKVISERERVIGYSLVVKREGA